MEKLQYLDRDDQLFIRQIVLAMIRSGRIRLPEIDFVQGDPKEDIKNLTAAVSKCLIASDMAASNIDEHIASTIDGDVKTPFDPE